MRSTVLHVFPRLAFHFHPTFSLPARHPREESKHYDRRKWNVHAAFIEDERKQLSFLSVQLKDVDTNEWKQKVREEHFLGSAFPSLYVIRGPTRRRAPLASVELELDRVVILAVPQKPDLFWFNVRITFHLHLVNLNVASVSMSMRFRQPKCWETPPPKSISEVS